MSDKSYSWGSIDNTDRPEEFAAYLDTVTALGEMQRYKQRTYQLLRASWGSHILDVGCGVGDDVYTLAKIVGSDGLVVGIDNSKALIEEARQRMRDESLRVEFRVEDAQQLSFDANTFDGCRADRIFIHLPDRRKVLSEMIRVTRPGGWIVVNDPDWDTLIIEAPDKRLTRRILEAVSDNTANPWSGRELYKLFLESGLVEVVIADTPTLVLTDFATANRLYQLEDTVATLWNAGTIRSEEAQMWIDYVKQADQAGRFFSAVTGFTVVGQKP